MRLQGLFAKGNCLPLLIQTAVFLASNLSIKLHS